jgi:hypothetical protein
LRHCIQERLDRIFAGDGTARRGRRRAPRAAEAASAGASLAGSLDVRNDADVETVILRGDDASLSATTSGASRGFEL